MKALLPEVQGKADGKAGLRAGEGPSLGEVSLRGRCLIPDEVIEEIKARVDVVALIGRHVELKRAGRTWKGCCPFHGERTPSFHVYTEDKHYKCYGCGEYGNVFTFLQKLQGKEFPEVVRELAAEVGIEIPEADAQETAEAQRRRKERNELLAACDAAARYWAARLGSTLGRGRRRATWRRGAWRRSRSRPSAWGWRRRGGTTCVPRLKEKGIGEAAVRKAGLLVEKDDGRSYDRFRGRLMFPIAGLDGQVIGFGGRAMGEEKGAKYINTPETPLYKKSRVLYGLDLAREAIRKTRTAVLVEGYFDVIGLHQAGVKNAVAVCGTALTPEHVELLKRCDCREVTVLFDGDSAGLAAPAKAAAALFPSGLSGKVALLPAGDAEARPRRLRPGPRQGRGRGAAGGGACRSRSSSSTAPWSGPAAREPQTAALEAKLAAVAELAPLVQLAPEGLARGVFEEAVARKLDLDVEALRRELAGARPARVEEPPPRPRSRRPGAGRRGPARARAAGGDPPGAPRPAPRTGSRRCCRGRRWTRSACSSPSATWRRWRRRRTSPAAAGRAAGRPGPRPDPRADGPRGGAGPAGRGGRPAAPAHRGADRPGRRGARGGGAAAAARRIKASIEAGGARQEPATPASPGAARRWRSAADRGRGGDAAPGRPGEAAAGAGARR